MNKRGVLTVVVLLCVVAVGLLLWWSLAWRRVDGRSASQWFDVIQQAGRTVSYHAEGTVAPLTTAGSPHRFVLDQGTGGRYSMRVLRPGSDAHCALGFDGRHVWYDTGGQRTAGDTTGATGTKPRAMRLLGVATVAQRPAVGLLVHSGAVRKEIWIDRKTGVVLAMKTRFRRNVISDMRVTAIDYRAVTPAACSIPSPNAMHAVSVAEATGLLGRAPLQAQWVPRGFRAQGLLRGHCGCCKSDMVVVRYVNGISAVTLFEMAGHMQCAMGQGCAMAPSGSALVATRQVGGLSVTAVGMVDSHVLRRILDSVR